MAIRVMAIRVTAIRVMAILAMEFQRHRHPADAQAKRWRARDTFYIKLLGVLPSSSCPSRPRYLYGFVPDTLICYN